MRSEYVYFLFRIRDYKRWPKGRRSDFARLILPPENPSHFRIRIRYL